MIPFDQRWTLPFLTRMFHPALWLVTKPENDKCTRESASVSLPGLGPDGAQAAPLQQEIAVQLAPWQGAGMKCFSLESSFLRSLRCAPCLARSACLCPAIRPFVLCSLKHRKHTSQHPQTRTSPLAPKENSQQLFNRVYAHSHYLIAEAG